MKASLVVKSADGKIIEVADPITVDDESVAREYARLRKIHGNRVSICGDQVLYARQAMERERQVA